MCVTEQIRTCIRVLHDYVVIAIAISVTEWLTGWVIHNACLHLFIFLRWCSQPETCSCLNSSVILKFSDQEKLLFISYARSVKQLMYLLWMLVMFLIPLFFVCRMNYGVQENTEWSVVVYLFLWLMGLFLQKSVVN